MINTPEPTQSFADSFLLQLSDMEIVMRYYGFSGHNNDETLISFNRDKTLIFGQILGRSYFLPELKKVAKKMI